MSKRWQLLPGDRVIHYEDLGKKFPVGTVTRVDPAASFFCYWIQWDDEWAQQLSTGAYPASAFFFDEMDRQGMCPEMTEDRVRRLEELQIARRAKRNVGSRISAPE